MMKQQFFMCYRLLAVIFLMTFVIKGFATDAHDVVTIEFKDGASVEYELTSRPKVSFAPPVMVVSTENASVEYEVKNVSGFHFSVTATDIREVQKENKVRICYVANDVIRILGALSLKCSLFDMNGQLLREQKIDANDYEVSLDGLPKGVCLLKLSNGYSLKFLKK